MNKLFLILPLILIIICCNNEKEVSNPKDSNEQDKLDSVEREGYKIAINTRLDSIDVLVSQEKYSEAIAPMKIVKELSLHFSKNFQINMLGYYQFMLSKDNQYQKALDVAVTLDSLSLALDRKSPWNCLKMANCYVALKDTSSALKWLEKAVYERQFKRIEHIDNKDFSILKNSSRYLKLIEEIKNQIGLGLPAKDFSISLMDSSIFTLSDMKGKVVLIDFWDVSCGPCREAMPHLKQLINKYDENDFVLLSISLDTEKELLEKFLKENEIDWNMACSYQGWQDETVKLYEIIATPSTWLVDQQGILRHYNLHGELLEDSIENLILDN